MLGAGDTQQHGKCETQRNTATAVSMVSAFLPTAAGCSIVLERTEQWTKAAGATTAVMS